MVNEQQLQPEEFSVTAQTLPDLPADWRQVIAGAVAELDLRQIEISRRLTPAQRVAQALSMIELAEEVAAYRLRQQKPELTELEALRIVRKRLYDL